MRGSCPFYSLSGSPPALRKHSNRCRLPSLLFRQPSPRRPPSTPTPSEAQIAPGLWEVERVRCSELLGADDDDRAAAAMFYYGYLAAKAGIHVIDVGKIDENVGKVMRQCAATPNITVPQAFREALHPHRSPG